MEQEKLPRYGRIKLPPRMRLTERDRRILEAVHAYDGILSFSQIRRMFFTGKSQAEERLKLLYQNGYLNRLNKDQRRHYTEMVYWLDKKGAELIASLDGSSLSVIAWRKEPRWFQVEHDLAVNDFRIDLEESCRMNPDVQLESWVPESEFWAYPDKVEYRYQGKKMHRQVRPDGFFVLETAEHRIRYLLEIDRSTEDNPRFLREKLLPGLAYIKSREYEVRFGYRGGRWLVVTTGERRLRNMLNQARKADAKGLFFFTTSDQVTPSALLLSPIWRRADRDVSVPLIYIDRESALDNPILA
jgi:hypothetical protein